MNGKETLYCSFCGKSQHEVSQLIAGVTAFICDECVELAMDIVKIKRDKAFLFSHDMTVGEDSR